MLHKDNNKINSNQKGQNICSDNEDDTYSDDAFDNHDDFIEEDNDLDDDKIVDEEIYLNTSIGKKDADALKEILHK